MTIGIPYMLLAEDDPDDREFFCAGMRRLYPHVNVRTFQDGEELLLYLAQCALSDPPACILLDYKMSRLNAPQILMATGTETPYGKISKIVWSTSERKKDMDECLSLGAVRFVVKPASDRQLDNLLRSLGNWIGEPVESTPAKHDGVTLDD